LGGCLIKNVVSGLNESCRLKLAQKITGADQTYALIDDRASLFNIAVLELQQR
jgi:hypothetical protein